MELRVTLPLSLLLACTSPPNASVDTSRPEEDPGVVVSTTPYKVTYVEPQDTFIPDPEYADLFVTIADTGRSFDALTKTMMHISESFGAEKIDELINVYIPERDSIMVPPDSEDQIWAGAYAPRRYPDGLMSVEYLDAYDTTAPPRTMALVTGIWTTREQADSIIQRYGSAVPVPRVIPATLYQGCMH